jgi:photosystem II stability/assembly factor-like uncharacterized protein
MPITTTRVGDMVFSQDYLCDQTLYFASVDNLLFRSTDGGQHWVNVPHPQAPGVLSVAVVTSSVLFLGVGGGPPGDEPQQGLFYTADSGQTWEQLYQGGVDDVAVSPNYTQDHTVLIGAGGYHWNGGILKSTDNGRTWQPSYEGLPWGGDGGTGGITFSPTYAQDHTVFCVSWGALYKSTDEGAHWTWVSPNLGYSWGTINQFVMSPRYPRDQTLWLSGYSEGNIISTDGGNTWRALLEAVTPLAAGAYCPEGGACYIELFGRVWGQNNQNYAYKSFDGGKTWHCLESAYLPPPMALRAFLPFIGKN